MIEFIGIMVMILLISVWLAWFMHIIVLEDIMTYSECDTFLGKYLDHAQKLMQVKHGEKSPWKGYSNCGYGYVICSKISLICWAIIPLTLIGLLIGLIIMLCTSILGLIVIGILGGIVGLYLFSKFFFLFLFKIAPSMSKLKKLYNTIQEGE